MAKYPSITLTNAGLNMIAESQGSGQLIFTSIKLGDGNLAAGEDIKALTAVKNPLLTANISNIDDTTVNGQITLTAVISNSAVTSGFFARELGVYAKVGSDGAEKLYAYTNAGNYADYMPDSSTPINENQVKITLIVGNAANVTAIINSSIVYTTLAEVNSEIEDHNKDAAAHSDIRDALKKATGMPLGTIMPFLMTTPPEGWLALDAGTLVSRTVYPDLWAFVQKSAPLISETAWQAQATAQTSVAAYSTGDGSTTFRLPKILDYVRGGLQNEVGAWQADAIRNITGYALIGKSDAQVATFAQSGVLAKAGDYPGLYVGSGSNVITGTGGINFDASRVVPTADENRPKTVKMLYCVKAFASATNQGVIDITALANQTNNKVDKTDYANDFTKNLATNGYQKLPSGLIIQWGQTAAISGDSSTSVTFPIAFPHSCFGVSVTAKMTNPTNNNFAAVMSTTNTGCTLIRGTSDTTYTEIGALYWFAIGY